ncbi:MAG: hypothetical protein AAB268_01170 [Elusimicrobiota bacterium]
MARRLNRIVSIALCAALVVLSAGLDAQRAAAQTISGRAASVSPMPQLRLGMTNAPTPLGFPLTVALTRIDASLTAAMPALQALTESKTVDCAAIAGRNLEAALTGDIPARPSGGMSNVVVGAASDRGPGLSARSATPQVGKGAEVPAAAPAPFKSIESVFAYKAHRFALMVIAALTGAVFTLPQAGPALTAQIIASAADKTLVLSDFDDTLAGNNEILPSPKVDAFVKIRAAGKHIAVISDRGDVSYPNSTQLTVFESLASLPVPDRAGMYVAANSGGKVYRYDAQGVPQKVHEAPALAKEKVAAVTAAATATKTRLQEVGTAQYGGDTRNPPESYSDYGYAMMLALGSSEDSVRGAAAILSEELSKRGIKVEVKARFAKKPENPPYIMFSIITKTDAAAYIASALQIEAKDALVIGDAMFVPHEAKKAGWLSRLGERLSGRPQVKIGNETDLNMAKKLPGVLTLGVGTAMDPRARNGWALNGNGPEVAQKVLESVASKDRNAGSGH